MSGKEVTPQRDTLTTSIWFKPYQRGTPQWQRIPTFWHWLLRELMASIGTTFLIWEILKNV